MMKKLLLKISSILMALTTAFVFTGCSLGESVVIPDEDTHVEKVVSTKEQTVEAICNGLDNYNTNIMFMCSDEAMVYDAISEVYDMPQYFWLGLNAKIVGVGGIYTITVEKKYSGDLSQMQASIDEETKKIIAGIPADADDFETIKYIHDYLCDSITYVEKSDGTDDDLYAALVAKECVCEGYADAFGYLLTQLGIENYYCSGEGKTSEATMGHAWNRVVLDGESYYFDVTWDDDDTNGAPLYTYFGVDSSTISKNHFADESHPLVSTNATDYNYYYHYGYVIEEYSEEALAEVFKLQGDVVDLKCSSDLAYWKMTESFSNGNYIVKILDLAEKSWDYNTTFSYIVDDEARSMRLFIH